MSNQSDAVKRWRTNTKRKIVEAMGGCCQICSYNRYHGALDLHHIDPTQKEILFGKIIANPKAWNKIANELSKCILLCSNCHRELHAGLVDIPENYQKFDYNLITVDTHNLNKTICPICENIKPIRGITCSRSCAAKRANSVDWDSIDLKQELKTRTVLSIADSLGCSDAAVHKRIKKLGLR